MALSQDQARQRFAGSRVARLATASATSVPHLVPVTFAIRDDVIVFAVDHKPKTTMSLKRLRNIEENPQVTLLVDEYDDDWANLWWVRADGVARVVHEDEERRLPLEWLCDKYPQYREVVPAGPVVWVEVRTWRGWSFTP
ncbi:TIGR03668 family PPOX class F420-dependent oxidoreductase [Lentzea sp. JNUCC 0626]|uniref:TIGR03668 family PPOX class F420-dependent oxidoreductase n=1 Tax=Lentzea sp. JNUCC 0626 TaxID=3367513 RepID=UPI003747F49F